MTELLATSEEMQLLWQGEQSAVEAQAPQRMKLRLVRYNIKFGLELGMQEQVSTGLEQGSLLCGGCLFV